MHRLSTFYKEQQPLWENDSSPETYRVRSHPSKEWRNDVTESGHSTYKGPGVGRNLGFCWEKRKKASVTRIGA